jgi:hypothetical protein
MCYKKRTTTTTTLSTTTTAMITGGVRLKSHACCDVSFFKFVLKRGKAWWKKNVKNLTRTKKSRKEQKKAEKSFPH